MPYQFGFSSDTFTSDSHLSLASLTPVRGSSTVATAVAPHQLIDSASDVDLIAMTLLAGRRYTFDIDWGAGYGSSVDLQLDLIDSRGRLLASNSSSPIDSGSYSTADPSLTVSVNVSGTYYIAVHAEGLYYRDNEFRFGGSDYDTGDYRLVVAATGIPDAITLSNASNVRSFSYYADNVRGAGGHDRLYLLGGSDIAAGGTGNDTIYGGSGDDELGGNSGRDSLFGGSGSDVLLGGSGSDRLEGASGHDTLHGQGHKDLLRGGGGNDRLFGGSGGDRLFGGDGNDYIRGGAGVDQLYGGSGADCFHFLPGDSDYDRYGFSEDRIHDFSSSDRIDLSDLSLQWLDFIGTSNFTGDCQVRIQRLGGAYAEYQEVQVNLSGNSTPELAFLVNTVGDFRLQEWDFDL